MVTVAMARAMGSDFSRAMSVDFHPIHELEKKREYGDRVQSVESASFTPLVFSTFGGLGRETTIFYSCLANLFAVCHNIQYS